MPITFSLYKSKYKYKLNVMKKTEFSTKFSWLKQKWHERYKWYKYFSQICLNIFIFLFKKNICKYKLNVMIKDNLIKSIFKKLN